MIPASIGARTVGVIEAFDIGQFQDTTVSYLTAFVCGTLTLTSTQAKAADLDAVIVGCAQMPGGRRGLAREYGSSGGLS